MHNRCVSERNQRRVPPQQWPRERSLRLPVCVTLAEGGGGDDETFETLSLMMDDGDALPGRSPRYKGLSRHSLSRSVPDVVLFFFCVCKVSNGLRTRLAHSWKNFFGFYRLNRRNFVYISW